MLSLVRVKQNHCVAVADGYKEGVAEPHTTPKGLLRAQEVLGTSGMCSKVGLPCRNIVPTCGYSLMTRAS